MDTGYFHAHWAATGTIRVSHLHWQCCQKLELFTSEPCLQLLSACTNYIKPYYTHQGVQIFEVDYELELLTSKKSQKAFSDL